MDKKPDKIGVNVEEQVIDAFGHNGGPNINDDYVDLHTISDRVTGQDIPFERWSVSIKNRKIQHEPPLVTAFGDRPVLIRFADALMDRLVVTPYMLFTRRRRPAKTGSALHLGRLMLLVMSPDQVTERLGDLQEKRETQIAPGYGVFYSKLWFWWTGIVIVLAAIIGKLEPLVLKIKKIWNTPTQG